MKQKVIFTALLIIMQVASLASLAPLGFANGMSGDSVWSISYHVALIFNALIFLVFLCLVTSFIKGNFQDKISLFKKFIKYGSLFIVLGFVFIIVYDVFF